MRVLLVEDSPTDAKLVRRALEQAGASIELERVETREAMHAALTRERWDAVVSDWSMPRFSARAALDLLKELKLDIPFVIVSGTIGEETAVEAMRAGAHDYVLKDKLSRLSPAVEREIREAKNREARRQANDALLASEARYRRIVETTNQGVLLTDALGRATFVNGRMAEMLGLSREAAHGIFVLDFVDHDRRAAAERDLARSREGAIQAETKLRRKDGSTVWVLIEAAPMYGSSGEYEGSFAMVMDVTQRKNAEEALRVSESRLRRLWDSSLILIAIFDVLGHLRDINEAGANMLGYSRAEVLEGAMVWNDMAPPDWPVAAEGPRDPLSAGPVVSPWEKELIRKDGARLSLLAAAAWLDTSEGIAIAVDITEKKRAQRDLLERMQIAALSAEVGMALAQSSSLAEILQRCTAALVAHLGAACAQIWTANPREPSLVLEASSGETVGAPPFDIERIANGRHPYVTSKAANGEGLHGLEWARRNGVVGVAGYPLLVSGQLVGVLAMSARHPFSDAVLKGLATLADSIAVGVQRKVVEDAGLSLEAQLRQAQKMEAVGRLAGGIAHDFNNVLSVILSYSEMMLADLRSGDPLRDDVKEIHTAGMRAAELTRQLLMFSRQKVIEPRVVDLNVVLASMDRMLRRIVGEDVELSSYAGESLGHVLVDPGSIEQVIMNLAVNARDAMPEGGKLMMETANVVLGEDYAKSHVGATPGAYVMLSVTDTGVGMDKATLGRIFEPFFTTKEKGRGTGLGLSTVFGIVQQSGGYIWVDSAPQVGTRFEIYLPRVDASEDLSRPHKVSTTLTGFETILLVEDEEQVRSVARGILGRHGYTVLEARNAGEALLVCERHDGPLHLLLTDVVMPQMSGPELANRLRQLRPDLKVLCMSGYADDESVRHGVLDAEFAYLQKPITVEALTRKVRSLLDS